jgi:peptide/nickel transport system substrate-binding protein
MLRYAFIWLIIGLAVTLAGIDATAASKPEGQLVIAFDTTIAPTYLDPAETPGTATPFTFLYALHDALIKPLPGNDMAPCLAESWRESDDGLTYEFKLREGLTFHNGDPFTAEDVKFSFLRYKGTSAKLLHERVKAVEVGDPHQVRFVLHAPWPDFLAFYGTIATGAAWIVPKKYIEQVGDDAFKQKPVGLGPYRFVRMDPGVELVLEANEQYWRKMASIKRIIFKGIPERTTRLAMLKNGEADISYLMIGDEATAVTADPKLRLARVIPAAAWWVEFLEQWDPKSRIETYVLSTGTYAYGGHADIDELFRQQSAERDRSKREVLLHQIQRLMHERVMHAPIYEPATLHGVGPRVEEPGVGLNALLYFTGPYEEMRLKGL